MEEDDMTEKSTQLRFKRRYPAGMLRANMVKGSSDWCYSTIDYAKGLYGSYETSLKQWERVLAELEEAKVYERVPENRPYGSMDALLEAELGVDVNQSRAQIAARATTPERAEQVHAGNPGDTRDELGRYDKAGPNSTNRRNGQSGRAQKNGIGVVTQRKLERIARERPDLRKRIIAGKLSVNAAMIEAGWDVRRIPVPDDPELAAATLYRHFAGDRLDALIAELQRLRGDRP
jgi:hypothetical protein